MIIDMHVHHSSRPGYLEELVRTARKLKIDKICLFDGGGRKGNDAVMRAHQKYPDLFIPFYRLRLGKELSGTVDRLKREGFRGIKIINPPKPYNHKSFYPVYERAEALGIPILFHTGIVGVSPGQVKQDVDSSRMKVIHLDAVARRFQKLTIIIAHLGNPDYGEAAMMLRWHANLYSDLSGSTLKKKKPAFFREMLWWQRMKVRYKDRFGRGPYQKIVFGTDVTPAEMADTLNDYKKLFRGLKLSRKLQDAVMSGTAKKLLRLDGEVPPHLQEVKKR